MLSDYNLSGINDSLKPTLPKNLTLGTPTTPQISHRQSIAQSTPINAGPKHRTNRRLSFETDQGSLDANQNDSLDQFHVKLSKWTIYICRLCQLAFKLNITNKNGTCNRCNKIKSFVCSDNTKQGKSLYYKSDDSRPGLIPAELQHYELSFVEEQLISLVCVNQYVYSRKGGSLATKGKETLIKF